MAYGRRALSRALFLGLLTCLATAYAGGPLTFYCESKSRLVSRRAGAYERSHRTWMARGCMRFDDGTALTTLLRLDTNELLLVSHETKTYLRLKLPNLVEPIVDMDDAISRSLAKGITRSTATQTIAERLCTKRQILIGQTPCTMWVDESEESQKTFETVRELAREVAAAISDREVFISPSAAPFGALHGVPLEVCLGDPKQIQLRWTIEKFGRPQVPLETFRVPEQYAESASVPVRSYTLPEHVYYLGEVTAAYFAKPEEKGQRSLLPREFVLSDPALVRGFYEGKPGAEQVGVINWAHSLSFYLAPELWHFPISGRVFNLLLMIAYCYRTGGLKSLPYLDLMKKPAN